MKAQSSPTDSALKQPNAGLYSSDPARVVGDGPKPLKRSTDNVHVGKIHPDALPSQPAQSRPVSSLSDRPLAITSRWRREKVWAYTQTPQFWIVLAISQSLALCITGTNTLSSMLAMDSFSAPAFQNMFAYAILTIIYSTITICKYGYASWFQMVVQSGWKYFIFAFLDVEANYFVVLAYRHTTILSIQLINFSAIVTVVVVSFVFLKVRYGLPQIAGILICCSGMGVLIASDVLKGGNTDEAISPNPVKGDLFAALAAVLYGLTNTYEEFALSKRPIYEVLGQLSFWGLIISAVQAAIFDRNTISSIVGDEGTNIGKIVGCMVGYTACLTVFYSLAPLLFRLASATVFNMGNLTANFWVVAVGVGAFGYSIHWMYPIAFSLILIGLVIYFLSCREGTFADSFKPWLGENQEQGINGIGTARRRLSRPSAIV